MTTLGIKRKNNPATMIGDDMPRTASGKMITAMTTTTATTMTIDVGMIIEEAKTTDVTTIIIVARCREDFRP